MKNSPFVSVHRQSIKEVNDFLANLPKKPKAMPTCVRHYGAFKRGILSARKRGHTNEEIAATLWNKCKVGPKSPRTGNFSPKSAVVMLSTFINNY